MNFRVTRFIPCNFTRNSSTEYDPAQDRRAGRTGQERLELEVCASLPRRAGLIPAGSACGMSLEAALRATTANPVAVVLPPSLEHIEERGVSAAFLRAVAADPRLADEYSVAEANSKTVEELKSKIKEAEVKIEASRKWASEKRREAARLSDEVQPEPEPEPELEPEPEPEPDAGTDDAAAQQLTHTLTRSMSGRCGSTDARAVAQQAEQGLRVLDRGLAQLKADLARREAKPCLTVRDVHKLLVVAATHESMHRYVELPGVGDGRDTEAGHWYVGRAQYFLSYSWDSPFEGVVDALADHTQRHWDAALGDPPPYYWVDIFAVNQHLAMPPWECTRGGFGAGCAGCAAVAADMHDWSRPVGHPAKGFERVIEHTKHTLVLNEPWDNPRPPTRVWCLFEGYTTLAKDGRLEVLLGPQQRLGMQLALGEQFRYLEARVRNIDAQLAEATIEKDREQIFAAIEELPGGFAGLNGQMQRAQREWLAESAQGVLARGDPLREPLGPAEMEVEVAAIGKGRGWCWCVSGAKATRLVERWPKLPQLLSLLGCIGVLAFPLLLVVGSWGPSNDLVDDETIAIDISPIAVLTYGAIAALLMELVAVVLLVVGVLLQEHQRKRGLRRPLLLGAWAVRHRRAVVGAASLLSGTGAPLALRFAVPWSAFDEEESGRAQLFSFFIWGPLLALLLTLIVLVSLEVDAAAGSRRASLAVSAGWLRLQLAGQWQLEEAERMFRTVHEQLQRQFGPDDPVRSLHAAPGLVRSLCELGRTAEAQAVVAEVQAAAERGIEGNRCAALAVRYYKTHPQAVTVGVGLLCWWCGGQLMWWYSRYVWHTAGKFILILPCGLCIGMVPAAIVSYGFRRRIEWWQRGALWRARVTAAARAPDAEVLGLLTEVARNKFGARYPLDAQQPELAEFLQQMAVVEGAEKPSNEENDRAAWLALPPLMRSAGENTLSPWVKYTHDGRSYYRRAEPLETSLFAPSEGVRQEAEIGMPGLSLGKGRWESEYFDLEGPDPWSEGEHKSYRRKMLAAKLGWGALFTCILVVLVCWAFVYVDCGEHGSWGVGKCRCTGGYKGDRCDVCQCDSCHCPALPEGMAEAYTITGAADEKYDGRYDRLAAECNGKPMYQLGGSDGYVLYQRPDTSGGWEVGVSDWATGCAGKDLYSSTVVARLHVYIGSGGGWCPSSPDGSGCEGRWMEITPVCGEVSRPSWCSVPSITVEGQ